MAGPTERERETVRQSTRQKKKRQTHKGEKAGSSTATEGGVVVQSG